MAFWHNDGVRFREFAGQSSEPFSDALDEGESAELGNERTSHAEAGVSERFCCGCGGGGFGGAATEITLSVNEVL